MHSRSNLFVAMACAASAGACSDLIGADFEDKHLSTNRKPLAPDVVFEVVEGTTGNTLKLSASDPDEDGLTYFKTDPKPRGRVNIDENTGLVTYESDFGIWQDGFEDTFGYVVVDDGERPQHAKATITMRLLPAGPLPLKARAESIPPFAKPPFATAKQQVYFGASVDFDGDRVIVGATYDGAYILRRKEDGTWDLDQEIDPPEPFPTFTAADERSFGWAVALSGDWALVGAYGRLNQLPGQPPSKPGQAHFYKKRNDTGKYEWAQIVCALPNALPDECDTGPVDRFGLNLALEGRFAVIAARDEAADDDRTKESVGAVYVYELKETSGKWEQVAKLRAPDDPRAYDRFGSSIALDGMAIAVAAMGKETVFQRDLAGNPLVEEVDTGAVYMFDLENLEQPGARLPRPGNGDLARYQMGQVALSRDQVLVGAPFAPREIDGKLEELEEEVGIAFLYERVDGEWKAPEVLEHPPGLAIPKAQFGLGVGIDGDIAVVTRRAEDKHGGLFVYRREIERGGAQVVWKRRETWLDTRATSAGWTAAVEGTAILVGAPFEQPYGGAQAFHFPVEPKPAFLCATGSSIRDDECEPSALPP